MGSNMREVASKAFQLEGSSVATLRGGGNFRDAKFRRRPRGWNVWRKSQHVQGLETVTPSSVIMSQATARGCHVSQALCEATKLTETRGHLLRFTPGFRKLMLAAVWVRVP